MSCITCIYTTRCESYVYKSLVSPITCHVNITNNYLWNSIISIVCKTFSESVMCTYNYSFDLFTSLWKTYIIACIILLIIQHPCNLVIISYNRFLVAYIYTILLMILIHNLVLWHVPCYDPNTTIFCYLYLSKSIVTLNITKSCDPYLHKLIMTSMQPNLVTYTWSNMLWPNHIKLMIITYHY